MTDKLISDFSDPVFQDAFRQYFAELGFDVEDWQGLFAEMNGQKGNRAYVLTNGDKIIGFIQFISVELDNWFFKAKYGFIREFWVSPEFRGKGHGSELLRSAEELFKKEGISALILTTDTAENFYLKRGFEKQNFISAANGDEVFVKIMK